MRRGDDRQRRVVAHKPRREQYRSIGRLGRSWRQKDHQAFDLAPLHRAHREDDLILSDEVDALVRARGGVMHRLVGHRDRQPISQQRLAELVPGIEGHELYVCGPPGFAAAAGMLFAT